VRARGVRIVKNATANFWQNVKRFQRIFNVFCGQVHGKTFVFFLLADSPYSADSSIHPAKTPRYGKSTVLHQTFFIHRMSMIRAHAWPLRMHENFRFYDDQREAARSAGRRPGHRRDPKLVEVGRLALRHLGAWPPRPRRSC
jgi:hypothetical protein